MSWDPTQYLRFGDERLRPALDLLARIPAERPARVVDLGCGPGNVTALLAARWPGAAVEGVDGSAAMLSRARAAVPAATFGQADIADWVPGTAPDVIYSNAALHWLGRHGTLLPRLLSLLAAGGWLAVQMPMMHDAPLRRLQSEIAATGPWAARLSGIASAPPVLDAGAYWDVLRPHARALDLWETTYWHALSGEDAVAQWAMGSSLRPFLDALDGTERSGFVDAYRGALRAHYPPQPDGTTLLAFRRLFLVAQARGSAA